MSQELIDGLVKDPEKLLELVSIALKAQAKKNEELTAKVERNERRKARLSQVNAVVTSLTHLSADLMKDGNQGAANRIKNGLLPQLEQLKGTV